LPQRQTALFAKQAADVDLFSAGRLRLGVGIGWNWVEIRRSRNVQAFSRRGKRQEQQIALIRKLWEQARGRARRTPTIGSTEPGILPRPKRQIPIWFGGFQRGRITDRRRGLGTGLCSRAGPNRGGSNQGEDRSQACRTGEDREAFGFESIQQYTRGDNQWPGDIAAWRDAGGATYLL